MADCNCTKEKEIATLTEQAKAIFKRIDEQTRLSKSVTELVVEVKHVRDDVKCVKTDVEEMKAKPGKQWQWLTGAIGGAVVTMAMGLVFKVMGLI